MAMDELAAQRRFLLESEHGIRLANRAAIHRRVPRMTAESILPFAASVANLRARYLEAAFKFAEHDGDDAPDDKQVSALRWHRECYEEARDAFDALRHAIERGYVDLGE